MPFCPHCGTENITQDETCLNCGKPLHLEETRRTVMEHLSFSYMTLRKYPIILLPETFFTAIYFLIILVNRERLIQLYTDFNTTGVPEISTQTIILGVLGFIAISLWGVLYSPFLQHLILDAVNDVKPSFKRSFEYARSRYMDFLRATLASLGIVVVGLGLPFGLLSLLVPLNASPGMVTLVYGLIAVILVIEMFVVVWVASASQFMVWTGLGFRDSLGVSYRFFRARLGIVFRAGIVYAVVLIVLDYVPFSDFISFIPRTFFTITELDIYQHYEKTRLQ